MAEDLDTIFVDHGDGECLDERQAWTAVCMAGKNPTCLDIKNFWAEKGKDANEGDTIDLDEFKELFEKVEETTKESLRAALKKFDTDDSDFIEKNELIKILESAEDVFGSPVSVDDEGIAELIRKGDTDGDEKLSIDELVELITSNGGIPELEVQASS